MNKSRIVKNRRWYSLAKNLHLKVLQERIKRHKKVVQSYHRTEAHVANGTVKRQEELSYGDGVEQGLVINSEDRN